MKKMKIGKVILLFTCFLLMNILTSNATNIYAQEVDNMGIFDMKEKDGIYKMSEEKITIPFFRFATERIEIDQEIENMGMIFANGGIDVNESIKEFQILLSNDTIRVSSILENAIIATRGNVIIDSSVDKSIIVFAGEKVTVTENATLNGDLICFSNELEIKGNVMGSVIGTSTTTTISGKIGKDVRMYLNEIIVTQNDNIVGNIYLETENNAISIAEQYPEAVVNIIQESKAASILNLIIGVIKTALVYALAYLIIFKLSKEKLMDKVLSNTIKNKGHVIMSSAIITLSIPLILSIGLFAYFMGLEEIIFPLMILYGGFVLFFGMISTFLVASLVFEYIANNHLNNPNITTRMVSSFFAFLSILFLTKIPTVGVYLQMIFVILSFGIAFSYLWKRNETVNKKKK